MRHRLLRDCGISCTTLHKLFHTLRRAHKRAGRHAAPSLAAAEQAQPAGRVAHPFEYEAEEEEPLSESQIRAIAFVPPLA